MTRVFKIGEEIQVFVDEEFDVRIDEAPPETCARPADETRLATRGSTGVRPEGGTTFFQFKALAPGIQKVEFPPTLLKQTVEIQNLIGVPNEESADEAIGIRSLFGTDSLPPLEIDFPPAEALP